MDRPSTLAVGVETPSPGRRLEDRQSAVTGPVDDAGREREPGLAVGVLFAPGEEAATPEDSEAAVALRTVPLPVEPLADAVVEGLALPVGADLEPLAAFDGQQR